MKHISFIMPAYNCIDTVIESLDSIVNGNYEAGDEIIVVNDASTDATLDVVQQYAAHRLDSAITIMSHPMNKGTAAAGRNTGIMQAKNEIIFCLDADNILIPGSIIRLKNYMSENNADAAAFGEIHYFSIIKRDKKITTHKWIYKAGIITLNDALCGHYWPGPSGNYMFTKTSWKKAGRYFEPTIIKQTIDSWAFGIWQLVSGAKFMTLPGTYYLHRAGYNSHFVRENKKGNSSTAAAAVLSPFWDRIRDKDLDYILGSKDRYIWFDNLERRPIRFKNLLPGVNGSMVYMENSGSVREQYSRMLERAIEFSELPRFQRLIRRPFFTLSRSIFFRLYHLFFEKKFFIIPSVTFWGEKMIPLDASLFQWGLYKNQAEIELARFMVRNLEPGDVVFDVGAEYGFETLLCSHLVGEKGSVHAFEPTPSTFSFLKHNTKGKRNVSLVQKAAWENETEIRFTDYGNSFSSYNTYLPDACIDGVMKDIKKQTINVQTISLDAYADVHYLKPDFVKIDAEESELFVLKGMTHILRDAQPLLSVEFLGGSRWGEKNDDVIDFLKSFSYKPYVSRYGALTPYDGSRDFVYENIIFTYEKP